MKNYRNVIVGAIFAGILTVSPAFAGGIDNTSNSNSGAVSSSGVAINTYGSKGHKMVPSAIAPGLTASAVETCMGSASAGGSGSGWGFSFGTTYTDKACNLRLTARTLFSMGYRPAAAYVMCRDPDAAWAMAQSGLYCPGTEYARQAPVKVAPVKQRVKNAKVSAVNPNASHGPRGGFFSALFASK